MPPIFVTGAAGDVGAGVLQRLQTMGYPVRAGAHHLKQQASAGVEWVGFDFAYPATFPAVLAGVKQIFLMRPPDLSLIISRCGKNPRL